MHTFWLIGTCVCLSMQLQAEGSTWLSVLNYAESLKLCSIDDRGRSAIIAAIAKAVYGLLGEKVAQVHVTCTLVIILRQKFNWQTMMTLSSVFLDFPSIQLSNTEKKPCVNQLGTVSKLRLIMIERSNATFINPNRNL